MANTCVVFKDAEAQQIGIHIVDTNGVVLASASSIYVTLDDLNPGDAVPRLAKFRLLQWKDATTCNLWGAYVLMTAPESPPPPPSN